MISVQAHSALKRELTGENSSAEKEKSSITACEENMYNIMYYRVDPTNETTVYVCGSGSHGDIFAC